MCTQRCACFQISYFPKGSKQSDYTKAEIEKLLLVSAQKDIKIERLQEECEHYQKSSFAQRLALESRECEIQHLIEAKKRQLEMYQERENQVPDRSFD